MLATIVYLTLASVAAQTLSKRWTRLYVIAAALLLAFLVGLSRVIVGVHYPTDVLAGWTAGAAWALLCGSAASWLRHRGRLEEKVHPAKPNHHTS
jgi:undecaprenyl-diphosphatase